MQLRMNTVSLGPNLSLFTFLVVKKYISFIEIKKIPSFCNAHQLLRKHCDFKGGGDVHRSPKNR